VNNPFRDVRVHWHDLMGKKFKTMHGVRLATDGSKPNSLRREIIKGRYERHEARLLALAVSAGDRVLEIGGGIGFIGILATKRAGEGRVTSYEANPDMADVIRANYALNGLAGDVRMKAITADGRPVTFFRADNVRSSSFVDLEEGGEEIRVPSDSIEDAMDATSPDVVVMDVEGAEVEILPLAAARGVPRLLVEFHPHITGAARVEALKADVLEAGYRIVRAMGGNILFAAK